MPNNIRLTEVVTRCHNQLDDLFLLHQEAVILGKFDEALQLLKCFKELHHLHMRFEDEQLIPELDGIDDLGRWPASLYSAEHAKVQSLMERTVTRLQSLGESPVSRQATRRQIIDLLDDEKSFKGLCEHHQEREESGLLPELDSQTGDRWRATVIGSFQRSWNDCVERNMIIVNGIDLR
jgi:hypothetical protein